MTEVSCVNKRFLAGLMAGALFLGGAASADVDLSGMGYEELVALHADVISAIGECGETIRFKVGAGIYYAGKDFPVGRYRIDPYESDFTNYDIDDENGGRVLGGFIDYDDGIYIGAIDMLEGYSFKSDRGAIFSSTTGVEFE